MILFMPNFKILLLTKIKEIIPVFFEDIVL